MASGNPHSSQNGRGSIGHGGSTSGLSGRQFNAQALRLAAQEEIAQLTQYSSIDTLLDRIRQANQQVHADVSFRRPDRAYVEWLKSEAILALLSKHREFPYLRQDRKERHTTCRKEHEAQNPMFEELRALVEGGSSERPSSEAASRPSSSASNTPRPPSRPQTNGTPPPTDPLLARFSQLRVGSSSSGKLPYPMHDNALLYPDPKNGPTRTSPNAPARGSPEVGKEKPFGPRQMPPPAYSPPPPPKHPLSSLSTTLPRAPDPIYSPSKTNESLSNVTPPRPTGWIDPNSKTRLVQTTQTYVQPANGDPSKSSQRDAGPSRPLEAPRPPLPQAVMISAEDLFKTFKAGYQVLLIDVRSRELFDEGHIHQKSIVCIDPLTLRYGMSFDQLIEGLVLSPDLELDLLESIGKFDLVVYYDEVTSSDVFLKGAPRSANPPELRALYDTLVEFNDRSPLRQIPTLLEGGLHSWMDLVGPHALQTSNTLDIPKTRRLPKTTRPPIRRISIANNNSSREIRRRRLQNHRPLNPEEEREWIEKVKREQIAEPAAGEDSSNGAVQLDKTSVDMIHTYDDFFRRFPSVEQQSMVTPKPPPPPPRLPPSVPSIPSRPAPAVSRPSYSGVSDREGAQNSLSRQASAKQPPLYISRSVPQALRLPRTGLKNFSSTCYMNATIQCLQATTPLLAFFLNDGFRFSVQKNPRGSDGILPEIFANLLRGLWRNTDAVVRPVTLQKLGGRLRDDWANVGVQQDAKEYFDFLIDILHEDLNVNFQKSVLRELTDQEEQVREKMVLAQASKIEWDRWSHRESSAISHFFYGQHASRLRCTTCRQTSTRYEPFTSLAVEIPTKGYTTLQQCLKNYCKEEMLDTGEEWMCPHCKCRRQATKQILITRVPQILCIHLKRFFRVDRAQQKISTIVDFPLHGLDIGPCVGATFRREEANSTSHPDWAVTPPFAYDAYAVMRHHGNTIMSGHYTAVVKDKVRNMWVNFNDERVAEVDPPRLPAASRLQNSEAYILFYERVRPR